MLAVALLPAVKIGVCGTLYLRGGAVSVVMGKPHEIGAADLIVIGIDLGHIINDFCRDSFRPRSSPLVVPGDLMGDDRGRPGSQRGNIMVCGPLAFHIESQFHFGSMIAGAVPDILYNSSNFTASANRGAFPVADANDQVGAGRNTECPAFFIVTLIGFGNHSDRVKGEFACVISVLGNLEFLDKGNPLVFLKRHIKCLAEYRERHTGRS